MLPRGVVTKEKISALSFVFLMLTMSFSASMQAWDFPELEQEEKIRPVSSGTTFTMVKGFFGSIPTNMNGNASSGTYSIDAGTSGLEFTSAGYNRTSNSIAIGSTHICFNVEAGLLCQGSNTMGQLGIGTNTAQNKAQQVNLGTGRTAVSVSAGSYHTCAVLDDGSLKCWGYDNHGQLGIGTNTNQNTPQQVSLGTGRTAVSKAGTYHTCAVLDDGSSNVGGTMVTASLELAVQVPRTRRKLFLEQVAQP